MKKKFFFSLCLLFQAEAMDSDTLLQAAFKSDKERVKMLIESGADVNAQNENGINPLLIASHKGDAEIVSLLVAAGATALVSALVQACYYGHVQVVKILIAARAHDLVKTSTSDLTPLFAACEKHYLEIVTLLLAAGADVQLRDIHGNTPLIRLSFHDRQESGAAKKMAHLLLCAGADVDAQNLNNESALSKACSTGKTKMVKMLLAAGAHVNLQDTLGWTPLMQAASNDRLQIAQLLLGAGADTTLKNSDNQTALQKAEAVGTSKIAILLRSLQEFLNNPLVEVVAPTRERNFIWSIAYKKDEAYRSLIEENPELLKDVKLVARGFLVAARVGNIPVLLELKNRVKSHKSAGVKAVLLKALFYLSTMHPERSLVICQLLAEDVAPMM